MGKLINQFNGGNETPTVTDTDKFYKRDDSQSSANAKDQFITWASFKNVIKALFSSVAVSGSYNDLSNKPSLFSGLYTDLSSKSSLSTVATSSSYNDLSNKPTILSNTNQLTDGAGLLTKLSAPVGRSANTVYQSGAASGTWTNSASLRMFNGNYPITICLPIPPDWYYKSENTWGSNPSGLTFYAFV